jgi:hypothetical protein
MVQKRAFHVLYVVICHGYKSFFLRYRAVCFRFVRILHCCLVFSLFEIP